jgi:trk system potassium uptake protein TrkA
MKKNDEKYIIIIGCGRFGAHLALLLSKNKKNSIVIIDKKESAFERLGSEYSGFLIQADAVEIDTLRNAKIQKADVVVATTNYDNTNIMVAQMAKRLFNVPTVVARLNDPVKEKIYAELEIETISPTELSSKEFVKIIHEGR